MRLKPRGNSKVLAPKDALNLLHSSAAPSGMHVRGCLSIDEKVTSLPAGLVVNTLNLTSARNLKSLPEDLTVQQVDLTDCRTHDPARFLVGLKCKELNLRNSAVRTLPSSLQVSRRLVLNDCVQLTGLPENLHVGILQLSGCVALRKLPGNLKTNFLDISGCNAMENWPKHGEVTVGRLRASRCRWITLIPSWVGPIAQLDVRDCPNLHTLPETLEITSWIDIAGTAIKSLPKQMSGVGFRWRGVPVEERIIFQPETITCAEVLSERNAERRRVLIERMGYEKFLSEAHAETIDTDTDPGGERRLLRVELERDEALVCIAVKCPSTGRQYVIRVPPTTPTCRHAAAWIAGFDNVDDYNPVLET